MDNYTCGAIIEKDELVFRLRICANAKAQQIIVSTLHFAKANNLYVRYETLQTTKRRATGWHAFKDPFATNIECFENEIQGFCNHGSERLFELECVLCYKVVGTTPYMKEHNKNKHEQQ